VITLVWRTLRRMSRRFASILGRFHAGTLPAPGSARRLGRVRAADVSHPSHAPRSPDLPRCFGWVIQTISWFVMVRHYELEEMLENPGTAALVAGAPQLGRVLRPLCRMLAVKPPAWLRLPRRRRPAPARPAGRWVVLRVGAGELWRRPDSLWPTREEAQKFNAKIRVWVEEQWRCAPNVTSLQQ
jgi:hypothetical protein